jgi:transcriptional regulator with XRE-family HTH domain
VRDLRKERGWSQEEFADRADLHHMYASGIERGVRNPTLVIIERIAVAFGISIAELFDEY